MRARATLPPAPVPVQIPRRGPETARRAARRLCALATLLLASSLAAPSRAQDGPVEGLMKSKNASDGSTSVATQGFEAPSDKPKPDDKDSTELKLSFGGLATAGNSRSLAITSSGKFHERRGDNQLAAAAAANYGEAASKGSKALETTVENLQGKLRYDRFVASHAALFLSFSALRDRFQGLDLRLNLDPGFAYYFVDESKQRFWGELGYDLQHDVRRQETLDKAAADGKVLPRTDTRHSGRAFAGYENSVTPNVSIDTGVEYLQAFAHSEEWRLNWDFGVTSALGGHFSIATTFAIRYDHAPLPGIENTDMTTSISLVAQLL